jgi:DinB superfamily
MESNLPQTVALLTNTPAALNALLRNLPDSWTHYNEGPGTWTAYDVILHLIHNERVNWIPRARLILDHGETRAFTPLDREASIGMPHTQTLPQLLDDFARLRATSLSQLNALNLTEHDLARCGLHPAFGSITLSQLLSTWAAHDLTHLHQLTRIMAHQYRASVGPYQKYLGVLHCNGHSAKD